MSSRGSTRYKQATARIPKKRTSPLAITCSHHSDSFTLQQLNKKSSKITEGRELRIVDKELKQSNQALVKFQRRKKINKVPESSTENSSHEEARQSIQVSNCLHHEVGQQLIIVSDPTGQVGITVMVGGVNQKTSVATNWYDANDTNGENSNSTEINLKIHK